MGGGLPQQAARGAGTMQIEFMRDAATGFAVLALLDGTGLH
jgi:hypothetical protein